MASLPNDGLGRVRRSTRRVADAMGGLADHTPSLSGRHEKQHT